MGERGAQPRALTSRELARLKLSAEVAWYLQTRGIALPTCPPKFKTPEPNRVRGARFDPARVDKVLTAFGLLRHTQGQWAGLPLNPDPWQIAYIIAPVFGWVIRDKDAGGWVRIIRALYVDLPRRNGKTTLAGGVALYLTCADGEPGAQVVAAATQEKQARYLFDPIRHLALSSPALKPYVKAQVRRIVHPQTGSYFEPVTSIAEAMHGANLHGSVVDELHVHKRPDLVEAIETGTGSRRQPLSVIITTADDSRTGTIYARKRERIEQLAAGVIKDPSTYGVIWGAGEDDDPFAEETWQKANPGYGISPTKMYLRRAALEAQQSPADLSKYLRLHLGIRTRQDTRYIEMPVWDRNAGIVNEQSLSGRAAFGGLDLAATSDLTALCWVLPDNDGGFDVVWRHWIPRAGFDKLCHRTQGTAQVWARSGLLNVTDGDVVDYGVIRAQMHTDAEFFDVREVGYDRWNSSQLVNDLTGDGLPMVEVGQGYASMSAPTKELQRALLAGSAKDPKFRHGGNPLVRWQIQNLAVAMDPAGNVKPAKDKASDKIDGVVAAIIALSRAMRTTAPRVSAYETNRVVVI